MHVNICSLKKLWEWIPMHTKELWLWDTTFFYKKNKTGPAVSAIYAEQQTHNILMELLLLLCWTFYVTLDSLLEYMANFWKWRDLIKIYNSITQIIALRAAVAVLRTWGFVFKSVVFTTEHILEMRYSYCEWKLWWLHSRSVDFPLLKRTRKKIMEESWFCTQFDCE